MGFRDLHAMNIALISKQVWRLHHNPETLWAKVLKGIYFPNSTIWDAKKGNKASWSWVSILKSRDFINRHKAWHIKDGRKVKVCGDIWIHCGERIWWHDENIQDSSVSVLLTNLGDNWDLNKVDQMLPREVARKVLATPIHSHIPEDTAFWPYTKDGWYDVKTGYRLAKVDVGEAGCNTNSSSNSNVNLWKCIWKAKVMPKIKNFIWKLLTGAIPNNVNLRKRGLSISSCCPICNGESETTEHIFLRCPGAKAIWFGSIFQWSGDRLTSNDIKSWILDKVNMLSNSGGMAVII